MTNIAPEYVSARRVLLDALEALSEHLESVILVGAQAIYHYTGDAELSVPLMTTDGDLAINTDGLADAPEIGAAMRSAGFTPGNNPGSWLAAGDIAVDLMVVPHQAGTTKLSARAARIPPHDKLTARITSGLEPALVDNTLVAFSALEPDDPRMFQLRVAGPAALLTAKLIKIKERLDAATVGRDRVKPKDALDVFRLLQAVDTDELVQGISTHTGEEHAAEATRKALAILREHASDPRDEIPRLAEEAALGDPAVAPSFAALVKELLNALPQRRDASESG